MKKRIVSIPALAILAAMAGCPSGPTVSEGMWVFTITYLQPVQGIVLWPALTILEGGHAQVPLFVPPEVKDTFQGTFTWTQNGTTFTLTQIVNGDTYVYTGTVNTSTSVDGTWSQTVGPGTGRNSGTWSAEYWATNAGNE